MSTTPPSGTSPRGATRHRRPGIRSRRRLPSSLRSFRCGRPPAPCQRGSTRPFRIPTARAPKAAPPSPPAAEDTMKKSPPRAARSAKGRRDIGGVLSHLEAAGRVALDKRVHRCLTPPILTGALGLVDRRTAGATPCVRFSPEETALARTVRPLPFRVTGRALILWGNGYPKRPRMRSFTRVDSACPRTAAVRQPPPGPLIGADSSILGIAPPSRACTIDCAIALASSSR